MTYTPEHVHLVGSVGLPSVADVFRTCGRLLGRRLQRIPDGEPGGRRLWVSWQVPLLRANPFFQVAQPPAPGQGIFGALKLAEGVKPEDVRFDELGYALEARSSYQDFLDARKRGVCFEKDVELGFHLCYGDLDAKHFFNPKDAGAIVEIANAIAASVKRPIAYIHLPVPIERTDDAFFQPFDALKIDKGTELFLGVVHARDGLAGLNARIAAASKHIPAFGIATECGMARARVPEVVENILNIHAAGSHEPGAP